MCLLHWLFRVRSNGGFGNITAKKLAVNLVWYLLYKGGKRTDCPRVITKSWGLWSGWSRERLRALWGWLAGGVGPIVVKALLRGCVLWLLSLWGGRMVAAHNRHHLLLPDLLGGDPLLPPSTCRNRSVPSCARCPASPRASCTGNASRGGTALRGATCIAHFLRGGSGEDAGRSGGWCA